VVDTGAVVGAVRLERAGEDCRATVHVQQARTTRCGRAIGVAGGDSEAVEDGRGISPAGGDDMIRVLAVVPETRCVVAVQIAAENGLMLADITGIRVCLAETGVAPSRVRPFLNWKVELRLPDGPAGL